MAQRPARHHQRLALAHPQERTRFHRPPANPQRGETGVSNEDQISGAIDPEFVIAGRRWQQHVRAILAENQPLKWQVRVRWLARVAPHFAQDRHPVIRAT